MATNSTASAKHRAKPAAPSDPSTFPKKAIAAAERLAKLVDSLNPQCPKIGAGMMATMREDARQFLLYHNYPN